MELSYRKALKGDAPLLIDIYNSSFYDDYIRYGECPAYGRTKEKMEQSIAEFPKYIIIKDNIPVGVLSFEDKGNETYYLGCLCVIPEYQGMGIGTQTFSYMQSVCPGWKEISLITPADKEQYYFTGSYPEDSCLIYARTMSLTLRQNYILFSREKKL